MSLSQLCQDPKLLVCKQALCGAVLEAVQEFEKFVRYGGQEQNKSAYSPLSSRLMSNILTAKLT
jgi:hypothetical protein